MPKAQSALEYMMTYGWAILIIVVVAVVLYSMGIFNPRASAATSTDFGPFAVNAAICNSTGLTVAFHSSAFPDLGSVAYLEELYIKSAVGSNVSSGSYPLPYLKVLPGSPVIINVSKLTCKVKGSVFAFSGYLEYKDFTSAGNITYNASGTLSGTES